MKPNARMQQKKKKMALYEVFSKGLSNSRHKQNLEALRPAGPANKQEAFVGGYGRQPQPKPRAIQFNRGRVEVSLRYDVAIAVVLLVLLCLMGAYRLGERLAIKDAGLAPTQDAATTAPATTNSTTMTRSVEPESPAVVQETPTAAGGDNWIVIATHENESQLAPVQQYFAGNGIETQIRKVGEIYILHTKQTYGNPKRAGTDGEKVLRRIIELGANYQPPPGYRSFDFTTAYGMKKVN
jgi:hypothetical protein